MPSISLYAYWGKWVHFLMSCTDLAKLRNYLTSNSTHTIKIGADSFRWADDSLYFDASKHPEKYYIDMTKADILQTIDKAMQEHCAP